MQLSRVFRSSWERPKLYLTKSSERKIPNDVMRDMPETSPDVNEIGAICISGDPLFCTTDSRFDLYFVLIIARN